MGVAVGIDLGTTNSCVAVVQADRAKVVADRSRRRIHPSIVSYLPDGGILAGHAAKERLIIDPENTIYSFKRLLGRDFTSGEMQRVLGGLPYEVHLGPGDIPALKVYGKEVSLPEVSAMMLRHLKEVCSDTLGVEINEAVITVPANFNDVQRSSTKVAGRIAGFNVLRILNEPTAAALAYGMGSEKSERIAIYDFGGGTFDITVVEVSDDIFEVLSTAGDTFLGGDDFDRTLLDEMRAIFERKHNVELVGDNVVSQRMRSVAEQVKCQLSTIDEVQATLRQIASDSSGTPIDFDFKMARYRFEKLSESLVSRSLTVCDEALKLAGIDRSSLDALILVGGSTRIPLVRKRVAEHFNMKPLTEINPDEVVAIGAAIQAFSLTGEQLDEDADLPAPTKRAPTSKLPPQAVVPNKPARTVVFGAQPPAPPPLKEQPKTTQVMPHKQTMHGVVGQSIGPSNVPPMPVAAQDRKKSTLPQKLDFSLPEEKSAKTFPPEAVVPKTDSGSSAEASDRWPAVLGTPSLPSKSIAPVHSQESEPSLESIEDDFDFSIPPVESPIETTEQDLEFDVPPIEETFGTSGGDFSLDATLAQPALETDDDALAADVAGMAEGDGQDDWFGVLDDLPIPGAENDIVAPITDQLSEDLPSGTFDEFSDLSPPPSGGPMPSTPPEFGGKSRSLGPRISEPPPGESYPIPNKPALLLDVTPRGLGVATAGGFYDTIIERNAAIPVEQSRMFTTSTDNQTEVSVDVYQGESKRIDENTKLGNILLTNLRPASRGTIKIRVTFEIDTDGILGVSAQNEETTEAQSTRIALSGSMDEEQVEALVEKYAE